VTGTATDRAGNTANTSTTIKLDLTAPTVSGAVTSGTAGTNGWYTSNVTVTWTCTDALSGMVTTTGCTGSGGNSNTNGTSSGTSTINADTTGTVTTGTATDVASNTNTATVTVKRDTVAPSVSGATLPAPNAAGWNKADVTVTWTCTDATA